MGTLFEKECYLRLNTIKRGLISVIIKCYITYITYDYGCVLRIKYSNQRITDSVPNMFLLKNITDLRLYNLQRFNYCVYSQVINLKLIYNNIEMRYVRKPLLPMVQRTYRRGERSRQSRRKGGKR